MDKALRSVEQRAEGLLKILRLARAMLEAERPVELDGLRDQAGLLCAKVMDLPPELGRTVRPRLLLLMTEVDAVTGAVRGQNVNRQKADPCPYNQQPS